MALIQSLILSAICLLILAEIGTAIALSRCNVSIASKKGVQDRMDATCLITIENKGRLPVISRRMTFEVSNEYTGESDKRHFRVNAKAKSVSQVEMKINIEHCGKIKCRIKGGMLSGINNNCNFTILPELFPIFIDYALHEIDKMDCENYSPYRRGYDYSETYQIREYVPGDSIEHVHWKLSGKTDALMVKDASYPLDKSIMVMMDKSISAEKSSPKKSEGLAAITLSICKQLSDEELNYSICWNNGDLCEARNIQFESELAEAIPAMLTGLPKKNDMSCGELYTHVVGPCTATHVIFVSLESGNNMSRILEGCRVTEIDASINDYENKYRNIELY